MLEDTKKQAISKEVLELIVCPISKGKVILDKKTNELKCLKSGLAYPIKDGIPILLPEKARKIK